MVVENGIGDKNITTHRSVRERFISIVFTL